MATVKGFIKYYGAAVKRIEREQQRKAKEAARRYKEQLKQEEISNVAEAIKDYNEYVKVIQSLHKNCTEHIDWDKIRSMLQPEEPEMRIFHESKSKEKLDKYRPSIIDKVFGLSNKRINQLNEQVREANRKDKKEYELAKKKYLEDLNNWNFLQDLVKGLDNENPESYKDALQYFNPFSDISELGTRIRLSISDENQIDVDVHINGEEVIPKYELKQTARGKLSKKNMGKVRFNELYQDHVCSSIIRVSRELFAYLPISNARVNAIGEILNSATGYLEEKPILSALMVADTINSLNMDAIDPSDSMTNFVHNMKFSKIKGFSLVEKVELR